MASQLLINLLIAFLWMLLNDHWSILIFMTGYVIGIGILLLMRRFFPGPIYLKKILSILKLLYVFLKELIVSSLYVMKEIVSPTLKIEPGIIKIKTKLEGNWEITFLSMLLTLTPGSVILEVVPEERILFIHAMDVPSSQKTVIKATRAFEKAIREVTR